MAKGKSYWGLALDGPDPQAALRWFADQVFAARAPAQWVVAYNAQKPKGDWLERMATNKDKVSAAYFTADRSESLIRYPSGVVAGRFPFEPDADRARGLLEEAPFEVASFDTLHEEWSTIAKTYRPPSFSRNHYPHGWGCAFKGAGHEHLVSRRWLELGPWRLIRGKRDLSLVQFHALSAPPKTALAQAKPGHKTMGIDDEGGFLQMPYVFGTPLSGLYDAKARTLRVVVLGRDLSAVEMLDARAAVKQGALTDDKPLKRVLYVFPKPKDAQRHLHGLWLRELECWTIVDGIEQRLDAKYEPAPEPPEWVGTE